jgi:hypothetical protein
MSHTKFSSQFYLALKPLLFFHKTPIRIAIAILILLPASHTQVFCGDGIEWERLRIVPSLTVSQSYSDNIYLEDENKKEDFITSVSPEVSLDVAVVPKTYFSFKYHGDFLAYADADNFKEDNHLGSFSFNSETAKGSHFLVGVSAEDTSVRPYSRQEQSKDYALKSAYGDILLMLGKVTEIGAEYHRSDREFDELQYADDEYTRGTFDLHLLYKRSLILPLLLQYRYQDQDNNDQGPVNTDFQSHTVFVGARWRPANKLSGALRVGYTWAQFDETNVEGFDGYAIDTNLVYDFSEITRFTLTAQRAIQQPTRSARESGDYVVYTTAGLTITHRKWERITTQLDFSYSSRDYTEILSSSSVREDDYYRAGLSAEYTMRRWISFTLGYRFQQNNSDIATEDYTENLVKFGISLSL